MLWHWFSRLGSHLFRAAEWTADASVTVVTEGDKGDETGDQGSVRVTQKGQRFRMAVAQDLALASEAPGLLRHLLAPMCRALSK